MFFFYLIKYFLFNLELPLYSSLPRFTGFLPSSFSMYAVSLSSGLFLLEKPAPAVAVAAAGVILGWPFSILVFLPVTLYALRSKFKEAFLAGALTSIVLLVGLLIVLFMIFCLMEDFLYKMC